MKNQTNSKEEKVIKMTLNQAINVYKSMPEMKEVMEANFPEIKNSILKTWEELNEISGYYISSDSDLNEAGTCSTTDSNINIFVTEKQAKASLAMSQLSQLINNLGDECHVDWNNSNVEKYIIIREGNEIIGAKTYAGFNFLAFKTEEKQKLFLANYMKLIRQYFMLD